MRRFYAEIPDQPGADVEAAPGELDHLFKVLRARPGDQFEVIDGHGGFGTVRVEPGRRLVLVSRGREADSPTQRLILGCALPRRQKFDLLLKQAAELGVSEIHPIACERSVADGEHPERWYALLKEACKQSGNRFIPEIFPLAPLHSVLDELNRRNVTSYYGETAESAAPPPRAPESAAWLVGPEGGFTSAESATLRAAGVQPLNLGPCILRLETAAVCGLAVVRQLMRAALPLFLLLLAVTGCGERSIENHPLTVQGRNYRDAGDGEAALNCFRRVIAMYPDSPEAYLQAATLCDEQLDHPELAHYFYNEYLRLAPADTPDRQLIEKYRDSARTRLIRELAADSETERLREQVTRLRAAVMAQQRQLAALRREQSSPGGSGTSSPSTPDAPRRYVVKAGDYPEKIARAHRVSLNDLLRANNLNMKSRLQIGQELIIPAAGTSGQ